MAGHILPSDHSSLLALPQLLSSASNVKLVLERLDSMGICTGNQDEKYFPLQRQGKGSSKIAQVNHSVRHCHLHIMSFEHEQEQMSLNGM